MLPLSSLLRGIYKAGYVKGPYVLLQLCQASVALFLKVSKHSSKVTVAVQVLLGVLCIW